jgi:hypothetical protein
MRVLLKAIEDALVAAAFAEEGVAEAAEESRGSGPPPRAARLRIARAGQALPGGTRPRRRAAR